MKFIFILLLNWNFFLIESETQSLIFTNYWLNIKIQIMSTSSNTKPIWYGSDVFFINSCIFLNMKLKAYYLSGSRSFLNNFLILASVLNFVAFSLIRRREKIEQINIGYRKKQPVIAEKTWYFISFIEINC